MTDFFKDLIPETGETCLARFNPDPNARVRLQHKWLDLHDYHRLWDA